MRIALTHAFCWPEVRRGAERFLPALAAALARRGHDVTHFSAAYQSGTVVEDGVVAVRLRRVFNHQFRHEYDFGMRLMPRLALGRFDAVHSLGRHDAVASIRAGRLHPSRRTVITDLGLPRPQSWTQFGSREAKAAQRVVDSIDVYSGMSRAAVEALARNYGRTDGVVVPGGVDIEAFVPADQREARPTILFSGAIDERRKGVPVLLEALPLIAEVEPDVQVWLSGPGDAKRFLAEGPEEGRRRTQLLGLGDSTRQHERYGRAWVTCLPSTHDSFGMAMLESLACGTPIVTTTHSAPQDLVDEGVTGELCEAGDPEGLAQAVLRALELARDPAAGRACRESALPYDWDGGLAPLCECLYKGVINQALMFPRPPGPPSSIGPDRGQRLPA